MRLNLTITKSAETVPFDHIPALVGTFHKWLGKNEWHDQISLHSFSWLKGGTRLNNGLFFPRGAEWFISSHDITLTKRLIEGIQHDPTINYGLSVHAITIQQDPQFNDSHSFHLASPVLIKRRDGERIKHYLFSDKESDDLLTETLVKKLDKAGLDSSNVKVSFNKKYRFPKTKLVNYNGIHNRASLCPVIVDGTPEQIAFAWNVGIGNSTGIGFGALN
jgi:CRISPR-associated endoribonuclease Cas6